METVEHSLAENWQIIPRDHPLISTF